MPNINRYLAIVAWASRRFRDEHGYVIASVGGMPSRWKRIEQMAWNKYMEKRND